MSREKLKQRIPVVKFKPEGYVSSADVEFLDEFLEGVNYKESYFDVSLKAETFRELAELVQVLLVVPDGAFYQKIEEMTRFLETNLEKPEFPINQRLLVIEK